MDWSDDPVGERIIATTPRGRAKPGRSQFAALRGTAPAGMTADKIMALTRDLPET